MGIQGGKMFFFQIFFILFFIISFSFFQFHTNLDRLVALGIGVSMLLLISFVLIKIIPFFRFLTIGISLLISLSTLWMLGNVLKVNFSLSADTYWTEIIFSILCYCSMYYALLMAFTSDYFSRTFSNITPPDTEKTKQWKQLVDTSAIIDGRLLDIAKSGFISTEFVIPQFVIRELQLISDSTNHEKRSKGRRGLEMLKQMKNSDFLNIQIIDDDFNDTASVDNKLLLLAKEENCHIITTDFNLVKVAQIESVKVLNVNQLASFLRPLITVGDKIKVSISKKGNNRNQGIAFLPDDTMIVVEEGEKHIGCQRTVLINNYMQNESGKLAFAQIVSGQKD